jgi:hypothetical protein
VKFKKSQKVHPPFAKLLKDFVARNGSAYYLTLFSKDYLLCLIKAKPNFLEKFDWEILLDSYQAETKLE